MNKFVLALLLSACFFGYSQTNGITYQAVILDPSGEQLPGANNRNAPLANKLICLQFSFIDHNQRSEYVETIRTTTDEFGMVNLVIGSGNRMGGYASSFSGILWNEKPKSLKVEIGISGGCANYIEISNQPFTAVPFAFFALHTESELAIEALEGTVIANAIASNDAIAAVQNQIEQNALSTATAVSGIQTQLDQNAMSTSNALTGFQNLINQNAVTTATAILGVQTQLDQNALSTSNALVGFENAINQNITVTQQVTTILQNEVTELQNTIAVNTLDVTNSLLLKEATSNKSSDVDLGDVTNTKFPTELAVKTYVDGKMEALETTFLPLTGGTITGQLQVPVLVVKEGLETQFLKANGTLDSSSYLISDTPSIAIGYVAGTGGQGPHSIAIGSNVAQGEQAEGAIGLGYAAAQYNQGEYAIAIGKFAGQYNQAANSIAIGADTFANGFNSVALGTGAVVESANTIQLGNGAVTDVVTSAAITAGSVTYPNTDGTTGQVLTTNGTGVLSWTTPEKVNLGAIGTTSPEASAALDVTSTTQGFLPPRMTQAQRNAINGPVAGLVIWCKNCGENGELQVFNGSNWTNFIGGAVSEPLAVGSSFRGGKIVYIFQPGDSRYVEGEFHGIVVSTADLSNGIRWGQNNDGLSTTYDCVNRHGSSGFALPCAIGTGLSNTNLIIATNTESSPTPYAAKICADYSVTVNGVTYDDWFLPSQDEMAKVYQNRNAIGGLYYDSANTASKSNWYWTSSGDVFQDRAADVSSANGSKARNFRGSLLSVRPVRYF